MSRHLYSNLHFCISARSDHHHFRQLLRNFRCLPTPNSSGASNKNSIQDVDPFIKLENFGPLLSFCADTCNLRNALPIHAHLTKSPFHYPISLWNRMLNVYCQCGQIQLARRMFDKKPQRDVVSFNMLISAYARRSRNIIEAVHMYSCMLGENVRPNHVTLSTLLSSCVGYGAQPLMEQIHGQAMRYGLNSDEFVGSSLVDGYAKWKSLEDAMRAFDDIAMLDLVSWNVMIEGFVSSGNEKQVFKAFDQMRKEDVEFDCFTLTSIVKMCSEALAPNQGVQLHGCAVKSGFSSKTPIQNALITMYSKCEKGMESASKLFPRILEPNIISWTAMISGYMQNEMNEEAIMFYRKMVRHGVKENEFSFASILPAYTSLASLECGKQMHARIIKSQFSLDVSVGNALIDMYFKCGSMEDAEFVFSTMEKHDLVSWTVMIAGFGQHGRGKDAVTAFEAMEREGIIPDSVTFLGCLSACSHGGLVDEGFWIFRSMTDVYGVKPKMGHYACMIDMLGRAGRLKDAETFIEDAGIGSDVLAWETLLSTCRIHGDMELGERLARKIMEVEPHKDGPYLQLSNIYAEKGMWEEKRQLRRRLDVKKLRKEAGCSWVAVR